jgi:hypothetical protein
MADAMLLSLIAALRDCGVDFAAGLTHPEIDSTEERYGFRFPPDLRAFLQAGLPRGKKFPNWRDGDEAELREWLDLPRRGILFDVEHNGFWLEEWGPRPSSLDEARLVVNKLIAAAPRLIPIYSHRMISSEPLLAGNPIFSVHQTDIIWYGIDLRDYLIHEFFVSKDVGIWPIPESIRRVPFWDIERFQRVRWVRGACEFDNSAGQLP